MAADLGAEDGGQGILVVDHRGVGMVGVRVVRQAPEAGVQQGDTVRVLLLRVAPEGPRRTAQPGDPAAWRKHAPPTRPVMAAYQSRANPDTVIGCERP